MKCLSLHNFYKFQSIEFCADFCFKWRWKKNRSDNGSCTPHIGKSQSKYQISIHMYNIFFYENVTHCVRFGWIFVRAKTFFEKYFTKNNNSPCMPCARIPNTGWCFSMKQYEHERLVFEAQFSIRTQPSTLLHCTCICDRIHLSLKIAALLMCRRYKEVSYENVLMANGCLLIGAP